MNTRFNQWNSATRDNKPQTTDHGPTTMKETTMNTRPITRRFAAMAFAAVMGVAMSSQAQTTLANSYLTSLDVSSPTTLYSSLNFPSYLDGPLTGSSTLTTTGYFNSLLYLVNNGAGNTFSGNITVDSGTLRVGPNPFLTTTGGFTAPSMTSADTITINRAGTLYIDDNSTTGYTANRFGTGGSYPDVNLAGGTISLNGLNNASSSVQTFGALTSSSGQGTITVTRNSNGNPTLTFDSLTINSGSLLTFNGTALGTGTADARITFGTGPTLTNGIIAGARFATSSSDTATTWVTYGANGVRALTASDFTDFESDFNGAAATANVRVTSTTLAPAALTADTTINSLIVNSGTWAMGGTGLGSPFKLTLTSGMFARGGGVNNAVDITSGTLTAGTGSAIDLHIINGQQNITFSGTSVIADNGASGVVTLVKGGDTRQLTLNGANNTYSGGTYVVGGILATGSTANRTYLGTGKVTVDGLSDLTLGAIGATSFSGSLVNPTYTATNGGRIQVSNNNHGGEFFNVAANSIINGSSGSGTGLASLTRSTNITLAAGAIIGHGQQTAALNLATGTIQNLGTSADLYYGLTANQNNVSGSITIGSGTAFKGISTDRSARQWQQGVINIASGTTSVDFQGFLIPGAAPLVLTLGNGTGAGAPVINFAGSGTVDIRAIGALTLNDDTATYGNTGSSQNVRFVATAGSTITVNTATGMGSGTGIASALVQNGGTFAIGADSIPNALNGAVTVESGGKYLANRAGGLTGTGALTFNAGSILEITVADSFSGTQASTASIAAGTIVRLNANSFGATGTTLDSVLGSGANAPIFVIYGNNRAAADPTAPNTSIMTLNKDINGVGGILTNYELGNRGLSATTNGVVTLGARGGTIASTTGNSLLVAEDITGSGSLTIGTTDIIDGLPKLGTVQLGAANNYTGGTIVSAGTLQTNNASALGSTSGQLTVNTGGTLNMNTVSLTVGNLTGTGGTITGISGNRTLTIGQGDFGGGNYQGSIQNGGGTTALTKTGTGTITLSGNNSYTGATTISGGTLQFATQASLYNNMPASWTAGTIKVNAGTLSLNVGGPNEFTTDNVTTLLNNLGGANGTSSNGFAAGSGIAFDTTNAVGSFDVTDVIANSTGSGGGAIGVTKLGTGTLILSNANTYTGPTTVSAGTLLVNGSTSTSSTVTVTANATLGGTGTVGGAIIVEGDGTLSPGNSIQSLKSGTLTLESGATFEYEIDSGAALVATAGDLQAVNGNLNLALDNGTILTIDDLGDGSWTAGTKLTLISYSDALGAWNGGLFNYAGGVLADGSEFIFSGMKWLFDYDDTVAGGNFTDDLVGGRFVTMTASVIPEPSTAILAALGLMGVCFRRRRR